MSEVERAIREHCNRPEGASLTPLRTRFGHTALYKAASGLAGRGLLERLRRGRWRTTPEGARLPDEPAAPEVDPIASLWPPIAMLPTEVHRAMARFGIMAVAARIRGYATSHLPVLVIAGPTLSSKTLFGKMLCHAFGVPPERGVINVTAEAGKSIGVRRTAAGAVSTVRDAITWPIVVFDEVHRATPEVKRTMFPFLAGERTVPFENETLDIVATSLLLLNPVAPKTAGIERRTGFDETILRRSILADLEGVPLPRSWRTEGERALEAAARFGAIRFPEPVADARVAREDVVRALDRIVRQEYVKWVDVEMVRVLCVAAAAIGVPDPVMYVVTNYGTVAQTVGWVKDGWRDILHRGSRVLPTVSAGFEPSPLGGQVLAMTGDEATVAFEAKTALFLRVSGALGLDPDGVLDRLQLVRSREAMGVTEPVVEQVVAEWEASGRDPKKVAARILEVVDEYGTLKAAVSKLTATRDGLQRERDSLAKHIQSMGGQERVDAAAHAQELLDSLGIPVAIAQLFLRTFVKEAQAKGMDPGTAALEAMGVLRVHGVTMKEEDAHKRRIAELAGQVEAMEKRVASLHRETEKAKEDAERIEPLWREAERLAQANREAEAALTRAREEAAAVVERAKADAEATAAAAEEAQKARLAATQKDVDALLAQAGDELSRLRGDAATVQEARQRAREREDAAQAAQHAYEERVQALDGREAALSERKAALRAREKAVEEKEGAVEVGEVAMTLMWDWSGWYGERAARRLEELARSARAQEVPKLKHLVLRPEVVRNELLVLARPVIDEQYVPKDVLGRWRAAVDALKARLTALLAERKEERARHEAERRQLEEALRNANDAVASFGAWFRDPDRMTPEQADFLAKRFAEMFGDAVERAVYAGSRASEAHLFCRACNGHFRATLPTARELYAMDADRRRVEVSHTYGCGRVNVYEPKVLLVIQAGLAIPSTIRRSKDGG